ncbi:MAG: hypothetical protein WBQ08_18810 [Candidatus Sulfotelmatobacter sp.]
MRNIWLSVVVVVTCSHSSWAIYGPSLTRADVSVAVRACQEGNFVYGAKIVHAMRGGNPAEIERVLGDALKEWKATRETSALYAARAFCIHELVPARLPVAGSPGGDPQVWRQRTPSVAKFEQLGIEYFYYGPDGLWTLQNDPADLTLLAKKYLDSEWGRRAFLMMTEMGWSQGACQEGPDQFREVIRHSETFLKRYPDSEVSERVRLELANAYATWWNVSVSEPNEYTNPEKYKEGAARAKQRAIALYGGYLQTHTARTKRTAEIRKKLNALRSNLSSETFDYFCDDYED